MVKYPLIVLIATGLTLAAYELVRRWNVTRWLFGMKSNKKVTAIESNTGMDEVTFQNVRQ
jgi:hypothetical protein